MKKFKINWWNFTNWKHHWTNSNLLLLFLSTLFYFQNKHFWLSTSNLMILNILNKQNTIILYFPFIDFRFVWSDIVPNVINFFLFWWLNGTQLLEFFGFFEFQFNWTLDQLTNYWINNSKSTKGYCQFQTDPSPHQWVDDASMD